MFWTDLKHFVNATALAIFGLGFAAGLIVGDHAAVLWIIPVVAIAGAIRRSRRVAP